MAIDNKLKELLSNPATLKIVSNQNEEGIINSVPKGSLEITGDTELTYVEILESSNSYKNSVYSIWYDKPISVLVVGKERETYLITTHIQRIYTCGSKYEEYYKKWKANRGFDIAAVVSLEIDNVKELNLGRLIEAQKNEHPFFSHYDSLAIG